MPGPADVLQNTISITVEGDDFVFRVPSVADEIKLGLLERKIRRDMEREMLGENPSVADLAQIVGDPTWDNNTDFLVRTVAQMQLLLQHTSAEWVASGIGPGGAPVIDMKNWGPERVNTVVAVGSQLRTEIARFRNRGIADRQPAGGEALAGQSNTGVQPVQPGVAES